MRTFHILLSLVLLFGSPLRSEETDSSSAGGIGWFAYPYVFYTPETDLAFGGGAVLSMKFSDLPEGRPSSLTFYGFYSINDQFDLTLVPEAYLDHDRLLISGKISGGKIIDRMYGSGPTAPEIDDELYDADYFSLGGRVVASVEAAVKIGAVFELKSVAVRDTRGNPFLDDSTLAGRTGGLSVGVGVSAEFDSRDNVMYPSRGIYAFATAHVFTPPLGSDFTFQRYTFDVRGFTEPWAGNVLAWNLYAMLIGGTPPFYDYALLGGERVMRGYYLGRYRDRAYAAIQGEYRRKIWWRFGGVVFAGAGDVAPGLWDFQIKYIKPTYGAGLRFTFDEDEKMDLRMDVGFGRGTSGVYFSVYQAF